ncbi:hypothetical protein [Paraglaciecola aestuariivivens]
MQNTELHTEWTVLQTQYDSYESYSLLIKLISIVLSCLLIYQWQAGLVSVIVLLILWLQDAIWKTFQSRIGLRLEMVEQGLQQASDKPQVQGMQFNLTWQQSRPSAFGLVVEYAKQSLKPTVAYPYVALIGMVLIGS